MGVPTLNRYDKLDEMLSTLARTGPWPERVVVVDNGGRMSELPGLPFPVSVVRSEYNVGVAASWNRIGAEAGHGRTAMVNDDFVPAEGMLDRLWASKADIAYNVETRYSCFALSEEFWRRTGGFDEGFWPANYEDEDAEVRAMAEGLEVERFSDALGGHEDRYASQRHEDFPMLLERNARRFWSKWASGNPWGGCSNDELSWAFEDCSRNESVDTGLYFKMMRDVASGCGKVVEFGTGRGHSGIALLAGRPDELVSYDLYWRPGQDFLMHVRGDTAVRLVRASTLEIPPVSADLLFVDTLHTADHVFAELDRHAGGVRKNILLHDIVAWGEKGEDGGPGVSHGIKRFLDGHPEWRMEVEDTRWPGMLLLKRWG